MFISRMLSKTHHIWMLQSVICIANWQSSPKNAFFIYPDMRMGISNDFSLLRWNIFLLDRFQTIKLDFCSLLSYVSYLPSFVSGINLRYFINKTWQASFTSVFPRIHFWQNAGKDHIFHFQVLKKKVSVASPRIGSKVTITECKNQKNWHFTGLVEQEKMIGGY